MSEPDDGGLDELERQLQHAFASARPQPQYRDELWRRLLRSRPPARFRGTHRLEAILVAAAAVFVLGFVGLLAGFVFLRGPSGGASTSAGRPNAAPGSTAAQSFGTLPRPANGVRTDLGLKAGDTAPAATTSPVVVRASAPALGETVTVYRYPVGQGLAGGTVYDYRSVPAGLQSAAYPARSADQVLQDARAGAGRQRADRVTLTAARAVYVAVPDGTGGGYLEPAYEFTGVAESGTSKSPLSVLISAVADSGLR